MWLEASYFKWKFIGRETTKQEIINISLIVFFGEEYIFLIFALSLWSANTFFVTFNLTNNYIELRQVKIAMENRLYLK